MQTKFNTTGTLSCTKKCKAAAHVLQSFADMRKDGKLCDLVLCVGASQFRVHRLVMCVWSPVVRSLLLQPEPGHHVKPVNNSQHIQVGYNDTGVFEQFINYLYTGDVPEQAINVPAVLLLAASFKVIQLQQYCEELLKATLNVENMISVHRLATKFSLKGLEVDCLQFLRKHAADIVQTNEFRELQPEQINAFLGSERMVQMDPEIKLFLIISWLMEEVANRQQFLVMLLSHIDWSVVAADFLLEISQTDNFFTCNPSSLYLLLQTLHSSEISLGPYESQFEDLNRDYNYLLASVVSSSVALGPSLTQSFQPVSISITYPPEAHTNEQSQQQHSKAGKQAKSDPKYKNLLISPGKKVSALSNKQNQGITKSKSDDVCLFHQTATTAPDNISPARFSQDAPEAGVVETDSPDPDPLPCNSPAVSSERRKSLRLRILPSASSELPTKVRKKESVDVTSGTAKKSQNKSNKGSNETTRKSASKNNKKKHQSSQSGRKQLVQVPEQENKDLEHGKLLVEDKAGSATSSGPKEKLRVSQDKIKPTSVKHPQAKTGSLKVKKRRQKNPAFELTDSNILFTCDLCSFTTKADLKYYRHLASSHFPGPPHQCDKPECQFTAPCIKQLAKHRTQHGDKRPYVCTICLMAFKTKNNLQNHIRVHSDERLFKCPECSRSFKQKNTLDQHMVIHNDLRPYLCDLCGFSTKFQNHLILHKKIHSGDVFHCTFPSCIYSTPKQSQLKAHMRSHLGIRTHVCSTCTKAFVSKSHLIRHERIHSSESAYRCQECSYTSTRLDKLKEHQQKHHSSKGGKTEPASNHTSVSNGDEGAEHEASSKRKKTVTLMGKKGDSQAEILKDKGTVRQTQDLMSKGEIVEVVVMKRDGNNLSKVQNESTHSSNICTTQPLLLGKDGQHSKFSKDYVNPPSQNTNSALSFTHGFTNPEIGVQDIASYPSNAFITDDARIAHHNSYNNNNLETFNTTYPQAMNMNDGGRDYPEHDAGEMIPHVFSQQPLAVMNNSSFQDHQPTLIGSTNFTHINTERSTTHDSFSGQDGHSHFQQQVPFFFNSSSHPPPRFTEYH
ncbi:Zinc finger protein [Plakobranchus ocellatus]|uniref:Zinc finger protein n=1 Tax=Plakobranchus ocellatus TaxID=259542 RepID=A0AAV3ZDM2_9GAST|nr:Zinc finger protein [Plakobranchus ocellatus]